MRRQLSRMRNIAHNFILIEARSRWMISSFMTVHLWKWSEFVVHCAICGKLVKKKKWCSLKKHLQRCHKGQYHNYLYIYFIYGRIPKLHSYNIILHPPHKFAEEYLVSFPDSTPFWDQMAGRESGLSSKHFCPSSGILSQVLVCKTARVTKWILLHTQVHEIHRIVIIFI